MTNNGPFIAPKGKPVHPIRRARWDKLWTQSQLAKKSGVALRTVHSVEKWLHCRMDTRRRLLKALDIPFEAAGEMFPTTPEEMAATTKARAAKVEEVLGSQVGEVD